MKKVSCEEYSKILFAAQKDLDKAIDLQNEGRWDEAEALINNVVDPAFDLLHTMIPCVDGEVVDDISDLHVSCAYINKISFWDTIGIVDLVLHSISIDRLMSDTDQMHYLTDLKMYISSRRALYDF